MFARVVMMAISKGRLLSLGQEKTQVYICLCGRSHMFVVSLDEGECGLSPDWRSVVMEGRNGRRLL